MSTRYSLRATPRKKELFDGMVETPGRRRSSRRQSELPIDADDIEGDSSSAAESTTKGRSARRRPIPTFQDGIDEDEVLQKPVMNDHAANGHATNGHATNGHATNGHATNGHATNGHATNGSALNGHAVNGHATNGHANEEKPASQTNMDEKLLNMLSGPHQHGEVIDGWEVGSDPKVDSSGEFEFGGAAGTLALMIGFPLLMWYMWIGATYYDGKVPSRERGQSWADFVKHLGNLVYTGAFPSLRAWRIYWSYFIFELACYALLPGVWAYGKPLAHEGGKQLKYFCNAYCSFYFTIAVMATLHFTGIFPVYTFLDEFGPLLSVAIASGYIVSFIAYFSAILRGAQHRMTGSPIYDFFMGAELNPRLFGIVDFKMMCEVRLPWYILFGLSAGACARQYERYGYVSGEAVFLLMAHFLYANACSKGEELIVPSWDMYYEKWGFMLIFWNLAGVPLSYCHCTLYIANHHPDVYKWNPYALTALFISYLFVYWVWDSANSQKNRFRIQESGKMILRRTFPQVPWQTIKNPKIITSAKGDTILVDGWFGLARKIFYTCDAFFAISWGLITGFESPFPWFYPVFFCCMIAHRARRDIRRCRAKYGDAWTEYERQVPYLFIPYVI